jgi:hypothetical protein
MLFFKGYYQTRIQITSFCILEMIGIFKILVDTFEIIVLLDLRPGKIFRDCDYVYEKLFGFKVFRLDLGPGEIKFLTATAKI